jgi:WD40 repeat protein
MARIFISHSNRDAEQAARLLEWLHTHGFAETFLDFDKHAGLAPGADWERTLYREITGSDAVILILTVNWFDSKWCFAEFTQARALGKAIFPLIDSPADKRSVARDIQTLDLIKDRDGGLKRLALELTRIALDSRGGFFWDRSRPVFPGLLAFEEADAAIYFGRDDDIRRVIERLNARRALGGAKLMVLFGASGSGKSSLLRAGVLPRLKRDPQNWIVLPTFRPQIHPLDELAQAIASAFGPVASWRHWREALSAQNPRNMLSGLARDLRTKKGANEAQVLISIDQAEELFSAAEKGEAQRFMIVLNALLAEGLPFIVLIGLRSDYLGQLHQAEGLKAESEEIAVKPMPLERVRDIIEGPARVAGLAVDERLVASVVKDAATEDALPLLAFALRELYDRFAASGRLGVEAYRALGDDKLGLSPLENAVRRRADQVLADADPSAEELEALKEAFVPAMVRVNAEGEYVRRPARLVAVSASARTLIEQLAIARLLIISQEIGATLVEVAHEALLRKWPLLRDWLDEEREFLIGKEHLEQDLRDWETAPEEQKSEALLSGLKLTRAQGWLTAKCHQLSESERRFIAASITQRQAQAVNKERVRRRVQIASLAAAVVLGAAAVVALLQWQSATTERDRAQQNFAQAEQERNRAQLTQSRFLADLANQNTGNGDPATAMLLALEALPGVNKGMERPYTAEAELALLSANQHFDEIAVLSGHTGSLSGAVFSVDGRYVVTGSSDKTARIWDRMTGQTVIVLRGHEDNVSSVAYSPDGGRVVTLSFDKTARIWDAKTGQTIKIINIDDFYPLYVAFSPDGQRLATASAQGMKIWDAETGELSATLPDIQVATVTFSPDGRRLAATNGSVVQIFNTETGQQTVVLEGHTHLVRSAVFSSDGRRMVTSSWDKTARIWDADTGEMLSTLNGHTDDVRAAAFSADGRRVVTASLDGTARIWDAKTGETIGVLRGHTDRVVSAAFSPDDQFVITSSIDKTARIWAATRAPRIMILRGHSDEVSSAAFSPDGRHVVTASNDKTARIWDVKTGETVTVLEGHSSTLLMVAFSPDGRRVLTASTDKTVRVWDVQTGLTIRVIDDFTDVVNSAAFSPDGRSVVTASDEAAQIFDAETGPPIIVLNGH